MLFWTCVYSFQFALYLHQELGFDMSSQTEFSFQLASGFLLASRGMWSLATFLVANWAAIVAYLRNEQQRLLYDGNAPPKEEDELVQLNIALQREIVNFTALGIQRSVRDIDVFQKQDQRSISSRYSSFNLFVSVARCYSCFVESLLTAFLECGHRTRKCRESMYHLWLMILAIQIKVDQCIQSQLVAIVATGKALDRPCRFCCR